MSKEKEKVQKIYGSAIGKKSFDQSTSKSIRDIRDETKQIQIAFV